MILLKERHPIARKKHYCDSCCRTIQPGEKHLYQAGKIDGDFMTFRAHLDCKKAMRIVYEKYGGGDWGDEWTNIADMEPEEVDSVRNADPDLHERIWGK